MSRLLRKPAQTVAVERPGRFEKFNLTENPFPSEPVVNKDSQDRRINGDIFESEIRRKEYDQIVANFLTQPQSNPNHLRLGCIIDTSYIGRGNGKSAFLVNLQQDINREYCLDISGEANKCFALYVTPEPGGRTKTFLSLVDLLFEAILRSNVIENCLAILRLDAISELYPKINLDGDSENEASLIKNMSSREWFEKKKLNVVDIAEKIFANKHLQNLPPDFPIFEGRGRLIGGFVSQADFASFYNQLKKGKPKLEFVFSHLIRLFQAAAFNGAYILVDDFERIPDFQSSRQKKDFALELRSSLFDGMYVSSRIGFYNFFLVLHAGVPRLISDAWAESGMENRAPILPPTASKHIIPFEKLSGDHVSLLLKKYLAEYRIKPIKKGSKLAPFTDRAVSMIGELSEYNAAKILKTAYGLLDRAADVEEQKIIDEQFVNDNKGVQEDASNKGLPAIEDATSTDLLKKAKDQE